MNRRMKSGGLPRVVGAMLVGSLAACTGVTDPEVLEGPMGPSEMVLGLHADPGVQAPTCHGIPATIWVGMDAATIPKGASIEMPTGGDDHDHDVSGTAAVTEDDHSGGCSCEDDPGGHRFVVIVGTNGPDVIVGSPGRDLIEARNGDDIICALQASDRVYAGNGEDLVFGGPGADWIEGGNGADELHGSSGRDQIWGGSGDDLLKGGRGRDFLYGERGDDVLEGGPSPDVLDGGPGFNVLDPGSEECDGGDDPDHGGGGCGGGCSGDDDGHTDGGCDGDDGHDDGGCTH